LILRSSGEDSGYPSNRLTTCMVNPMQWSLPGLMQNRALASPAAAWCLLKHGACSSCFNFCLNFYNHSLGTQHLSSIRRVCVDGGPCCFRLPDPRLPLGGADAPQQVDDLRGGDVLIVRRQQAVGLHRVVLPAFPTGLSAVQRPVAPAQAFFLQIANKPA